MKKILILTNNQDSQAKVVTKHLTKMGVIVHNWYPEEFIFNQKVFYNLTSLQDKYYIRINGDHTIHLNDFDTVWDRHSRFPIIPNSIDILDQKFVETENRLHMQSLWFTLSETAKWINPYSSFDRSHSKILQLKEASRLGLLIPKTIITNDKQAILDFIAGNLPQRTLYKTFSPAYWQINNVMHGCYTTEISSEMLGSEASMALTPGIYQKIVKKKFEVRITFFDNEYVAVKIHNSEELDWRKLKSSELKLSPIKIPLDIEIKCVTLMKSLNIVFGCFDFIVTSDEEYIFLEVNPMGQFLWIEEILPELKLLDKFCECMLSTNNILLNPQRKNLRASTAS